MFTNKTLNTEMVTSHLTKFCHVLSGELRGPLFRQQGAADSTSQPENTQGDTWTARRGRAHTCASVACAKQDFLVLQLPPLIGKAARENSLSLSPLPSFSVSLPPSLLLRRLGFQSYLLAYLTDRPPPSLPHSLTQLGLD